MANETTAKDIDGDIKWMVHQWRRVNVDKTERKNISGYISNGIKLDSLN